MIINYSDQKVIKNEKSIFLAGPTPRDINVQTWRTEAIRILEELGFDGVVYVPERNFDDRTFDYDDQYWWEREALHNAKAILIWIPRDLKTMPAFTTNVEYGKWSAINIDKVVYGRPDGSQKNKYIDQDYNVESGKRFYDNLTDALKEAMKVANNRKGLVDLDSYELNIIKRTLKAFPEAMTLVGEVQFTPESFGTKSETKTYGQLLFPGVDPNQLKEFDRTILSVLLYHYIKDNRYEKFVELQSGDNKLTRETFDEIRKFMATNFNTAEKERLLLYYMVINDIGKSQQVIDSLKQKGIETVDHDALLYYLFQFGMLPTLNTFSTERKDNLEHVLNNGINVGQYIQGECVDYSFNKVLNLSQFEKSLMMAEAMLDIGGVLGHVNNQNGSMVLNQSTANNILTAQDILSKSKDVTKVFDEFLSRKADIMEIENKNPELRKTITRICLMMRLYRKNDIRTVEEEIANNADKYNILIHELNQSGYNDQPAILMYYSPALLNNANGYFKKNNSENSISDTLKCCLPFMQRIMIDTRMSASNEKNGIITVMLRDAAMVVSQDPSQLERLEMNVLSIDEVIIQEKTKC